MGVLGEQCGKLRELLGLQLWEGISWSTLNISTSPRGWPVKLLPQRLCHVQETEAEPGITTILAEDIGTQNTQSSWVSICRLVTAQPFPTHQCCQVRPQLPPVCLREANAIHYWKNIGVSWILFWLRLEIQMFLTKTSKVRRHAKMFEGEFWGQNFLEQKYKRLPCSFHVVAQNLSEMDVPKQQRGEVEIIQVGAIRKLSHLVL